MANYSTGTANQIIVGAAALFTYEGGTELVDANLPDYGTGVSYTETLSDPTGSFRNVGYTSNGLELQFQPDFGEVQVDQVLDAAKLYKQGMTVNLNTSFAEATLENLLLAVAGAEGDIGTDLDPKESLNPTFNISAGALGDCPLERSLVAVGPGSGACLPDEKTERIYIAYRALSIENVTVSAKRDEATMFDVSFRLLPNSGSSYGKIVDRTYTPA